MDDFYPITFFLCAGKTIQVSSGKQNRLIVSEAGAVTRSLWGQLEQQRNLISVKFHSVYHCLCESCLAD